MTETTPPSPAAPASARTLAARAEVLRLVGRYASPAKLGAQARDALNSALDELHAAAVATYALLHSKEGPAQAVIDADDRPTAEGIERLHAAAQGQGELLHEEGGPEVDRVDDSEPNVLPVGGSVDVTPDTFPLNLEGPADAELTGVVPNASQEQPPTSEGEQTQVHPIDEGAKSEEGAAPDHHN